MPIRADAPLRRVTLNGDCHEYNGARTEDGYGQFWVEGRHWMAHRYSYTKNNVDDCTNKGRRYKHDRKISDMQASDILGLISEGVSYNAIAVNYGISKQTVYRIAKGIRRASQE